MSKVQYWWDTQDSSNEGWYVRVLDHMDRITDDSVKIWFPVDLSEFGEDDGDALSIALHDAFDGARIEAY